MSESNSPGISPKLNENIKEISLFDPDTKDSGFSEDFPEEIGILASSLLSLEDDEACFFSHQDLLGATPNKKLFLGNKKRLFPSPTESPSAVAATSLKRLKIFELDSDSEHTFEALDFTDKILAESSDNEVSFLQQPISKVPKFSRSSAEVQKDLVKEAVEKSAEKDLIGDFSKTHALPLVMGSHPDLKCISVHTMNDILEGKYEDVLTSIKIVDSRYPYEFLGGHIHGALNIYTKDDSLKLLEKPVPSANERHVLIFHCEFSKERGPNMIRNLREEDRTRNTKNYPALIYPEVYVLEGGYKKFYEAYPEHCVPMSYKHMLHPEHADEMKFFRKKSKTSDNVMKTNRKPAAVARSSRMVRKYLSNDF